MRAIKEKLIQPNRFAVFDNIKQTSTSRFYDWVQLVAYCEQAPQVHAPTAQTVEAVKAAKLNLPALASHDANAKTKEQALAHNRFTLIWLDIDEGNHTLEQLLDRLKSLGFQSFIVYSTYTATANNRKWRVLIEINPPIQLERWQTLQLAISRCILGADEAATRPQQILFLPAVQSAGAFYQCHIEHGEPWGSHNLNGELLAVVEKIQAEDKHLAETAKNAPPKPKFINRNQTGIIEQVNAAYDFEQVLEYYGYKRIGKRWKHPMSESGLAGVVLLKGRYYSHHSNDPLADGHTHDIFDLLCFWRFGGDVNKAIKVMANELDPQGQSQRQYEYMAGGAV